MELDKIKEIIYGKLGFCGCAGSEPLSLIQRIMEWADRREEMKDWQDQSKWKMFDEAVEIVDNEAAAYCILFLLEQANLVEHGCSIRGAWLTIEGYDFLDSLKNCDIESVIKD